METRELHFTFGYLDKTEEINLTFNTENDFSFCMLPSSFSVLRDGIATPPVYIIHALNEFAKQFKVKVINAWQSSFVDVRDEGLGQTPTHQVLYIVHEQIGNTKNNLLNLRTQMQLSNSP